MVWLYNFSSPKKLDESPHKVTAPLVKEAAEVEAQDTEFPDEAYEVVEMQVARTKHAPAQMPLEGTANKTQPVESEASKDSTTPTENQEAYVNFDWRNCMYNIQCHLNG